MRNEGTAAAGDLLGLVGVPGGAVGGGSLCVRFAFPGLLTDGLRLPRCPRVQPGDSIGPSVLAVNFHSGVDFVEFRSSKASLVALLSPSQY